MWEWSRGDQHVGISEWSLHECSPLLPVRDTFLLRDVNDLKLNPAVGSNKCFNKPFISVSNERTKVTPVLTQEVRRFPYLPSVLCLPPETLL